MCFTLQDNDSIKVKLVCVLTVLHFCKILSLSLKSSIIAYVYCDLSQRYPEYSLHAVHVDEISCGLHAAQIHITCLYPWCHSHDKTFPTLPYCKRQKAGLGLGMRIMFYGSNQPNLSCMFFLAGYNHQVLLAGYVNKYTILIVWWEQERKMT